MINNITSVQNYNLYSHKYKNNIKKYNNINNLSSVSFKSANVKKTSSLIPLLSAAAVGIFGFFNSKKHNEFDEYFNELSTIPTYIYPDEIETLNPELKEYADKLDNLDKKQQKAFVKAFCKQTGFPNLSKVKKTMDNEILRAVDACFDKTDAKPIFVGYASSCSMGRGMALPGSDCDGLFVVTDRPYDGMQVNRFMLGNEINQRIIETQGSHYPEIFSLNELLPYIHLSNQIFNKIKSPQKIENYKQNILRDDQDFMKAGEFNLDIASEVEDLHTKDMLYLTAMFVEEFRSGQILTNKFPPNITEYIENSAMYKYSNVVRQEGFKNNRKPKWNNRVKMASKFKFMSASKKFEICSQIVKSTMGIKQEKAEGCYEEFDMGNISELIDSLTSFGQFF